MNMKQKILNQETMKKKLPSLRRKGQKVAFTNGCFDILHYGHVAYLEKAKKEGRILIVGLNSDRSIRRIKGPNRPIIPQKYRAALLASLICVDYVVVFNQDTPYELIKMLQPDVLIKGADWKGKGVVGEEIVKNRGGKVEFIHYISGCSTSTIIQTIARRYAAS
ncbi:MAG: D-glycero-beta-D-manno-heptose 1-phosphate adenylyltransferase [Candidatus Omnitrophica bacterium]|nr:D-glycero-beta-D-manno-heptose 1-phosphate adenylyltransferase [Candidatus Omnitrophota bacterium]